MNLYEVCIQVLEDANENENKLDDSLSREYIANEIYELFYEYQVYSDKFDTGYIEDVKDFWNYKNRFDEDK
jgi:hypothetical protein|tara:strand:- start:16 stop:228 length:213 start_codon:yes stop_codon:yes gene_type:complete